MSKYSVTLKTTICETIAIEAIDSEHATAKALEIQGMIDYELVGTRLQNLLKTASRYEVQDVQQIDNVLTAASN